MVCGFSSTSCAVFASPVASVYKPPPPSNPHPPTLTPRLGGFYGNIYICSLVCVGFVGSSHPTVMASSFELRRPPPCSLWYVNTWQKSNRKPSSIFFVSYGI